MLDCQSLPKTNVPPFLCALLGANAVFTIDFHRLLAGAYCSQKRRAAAPAAQFADEEEKGDKANEFVALKAPVFSSQTDLGIAG